jgi:diaminopimelate decarboxylase
VTLDSRLRDQLLAVARRHGTPCYVYSAEVILAQLGQLQHFDAVRFAQKACPNVHIQRLLKDAGALVDCVSLGELERAVHAGFRVSAEPAEIVYTADVITPATIRRVVELGVPVNAGSADMLEQLGRESPGHKVWLRINPGFGHGHSKKVNTGGSASKHGIWHEDLEQALKRIDEYQLDLVGLHMHIGSGADMDHLSRVCDAMVDQVTKLGRDIRAVSGGGGLSIPYRSGDVAVDCEAYFERWDDARRRIEGHLGHSIHLEIEPGRFLVGPAGFLLAEVRATKRMGENRFTLVDAGFNDLMRPAMYGAWHEIELLSPAQGRAASSKVVAGPLCESGDVFTQAADGELLPRELPDAQVGDIVAFKDAGAYGASMASNYNSRPLAPEVLLSEEGSRLIRRRQTIEELLALEEV